MLSDFKGVFYVVFHPIFFSFFLLLRVIADDEINDKQNYRPPRRESNTGPIGTEVSTLFTRATIRPSIILIIIGKEWNFSFCTGTLILMVLFCQEK